MKKVAILFSLFILLSANQVLTLPIEGKITDDKGQAVKGAEIQLKNSAQKTISGLDGKYIINIPDTGAVLVYSAMGFEAQEIAVKTQHRIDVQLKPSLKVEFETYNFELVELNESVSYVKSEAAPQRSHKRIMPIGHMSPAPSADFNTEGYSTIHENGFRSTTDAPLSTFSIDVDAASYSNVRRFLTQGQKPPVDAVRIEELINYFQYDYQKPTSNHPFSINYEMAVCPWNHRHQLVHIGLQGKQIQTNDLPASNLVFLIDVSGSMNQPNKLPLLKNAFKLLVNQLRANDKVAIVVYAGNSGLVLPSTVGSEKEKIIESIERLQAGGSTAGAEGLALAYQTARTNYIDGGNNRIILATDGDFNVGPSSNAEMERLIETEREKGIFISVLGFGMGNYKDDKMEIIADKGNGNYSYIDNLLEAKKVLVNEFGGTLFTIAKDVKIQVEFNPALVKSYRLVGYENRLLNDEDFDDDKKDAGEMGAGHSVTALYEIVLANDTTYKGRTLKYQQTEIRAEAYKGNELGTIKFRYKDPNEQKSKLLEETISYDKTPWSQSSENFRFSSAVAGFGMMLRASEYNTDLDYDKLIQLAKNAKGTDEGGYRSEFLHLIELAKEL